MSRKPTQKQYAFAMAYLETGKPSASYRAAGYDCRKMSDNAIAVEANALLKNPNVALIIQEGREEARERCQVTIESLTDELESARTTALRLGQIAAAVAATMGKAKLHGLLNPEALPAPALDLKLILGGVDEDELMRRYAETIILRQQRRKQIASGGNGSGNGGGLRS